MIKAEKELIYGCEIILASTLKIKKFIFLSPPLHVKFFRCFALNFFHLRYEL